MRLHGLRVEFVDLVLFHVEEQITLPEVHQQESLFLRVIHVPRFRGLAIEFYDGKGNRLPKRLFAGLQADTQRKPQQQYPGDGNQTMESHLSGRCSFSIWRRDLPRFLRESSLSPGISSVRNEAAKVDHGDEGATCRSEEIPRHQCHGIFTCSEQMQTTSGSITGTTTAADIFALNTAGPTD